MSARFVVLGERATHETHLAHVRLLEIERRSKRSTHRTAAVLAVA
jgi:hypothetical protein